jgi:hypothetical protein
LLGLENIGADDDFFMIGGDSLLAMRACSRLAARLRVDINIRDIFEAPTPRQFAKRLAVAGKEMDRDSGENLRILVTEIEALPIDQVRRQLDN